MPTTFRLCPDCLALYRAIRLDPAARIAPNLIPFASIIWSDEHQPFREGALDGHEMCKHTLIILTSVRKNLWRTGQMAPELQPFWRQAMELLPDWPGFQRLTLTAEQLKYLDACEEETDEMFNSVRSNSSVFSVEDKGDGVIGFVAHPRQPPPA